ncbi:SDR family NAD(P)-dependent oxidoreductase [Cytophaga aurantiaca]|uniref:SDR family NAD(P)-dependent oxidoreductase n=1 Tax=Cytophaga aurantiaca TaxID=29530 RepID=UPI000382B234|nr:SDR family NAD(P)-dependent oxidoreductase [Cytophaga aurantiaca]
MNSYYISGTSSGIGKAIALVLLEREDTRVIGISRTCTIEHIHYTHVYADLSDPAQVAKTAEIFKAKHTETEKLYLINNAGVIDPIQYAQAYSEVEIQRLMQVNLIASIQLISAFLKIPKSKYNSRIILSVSSGAAAKVIDGWSLYGAAKAGLDHFSRHVARELELAGDNRTRIFSVAPGVVDTAMQQKIRETTSDSFSTVDRFLALQASGQLVAPEVIARKYCRILDDPEHFPDVVFSLRDLN